MKPAPAELTALLPEPVARFVHEHPDDDLSHLSVSERRRYALALADLTFLRYSRPAVAVGSVREVVMGEGSASVRCRLYLPNDWQGGLHVHLHGGGFWAGTIDELVTDAICRRRAVEGEVAVLAVDYRLAPENPFPAGLEDALLVLDAALSTSQGIGHDPRNVSLGGVSAGGNLAAAATIELGERARLLRVLLLEVPAVDLSPSALPDLADRSTREEYEQLLALYLQGNAEPLDHRVSPLYASDLTRFPYTYIRVSEFDALRPGAERFAARLRGAGVPVDEECTAGALHGVLSLDRVWKPAQEWQARAGVLLRDVHTGPAARERTVGS
ncbi:hypothetical protein ASD65_00865 [Microbacterium sp. Root61]|uniref:alpha/beta hydrolase n=1 Tax=Microbacterium sp. Root61 TaxID=1736570 RepID=UPI0006FE18E9|nr:alpha/beta hydrolase [Microbacterium sp. Root61]KRA23127.1 hypothetical protein ASD65_00865 [Microbacterium sp. Root61]